VCFEKFSETCVVSMSRRVEGRAFHASGPQKENAHSPSILYCTQKSARLA